MDRVIVDTDTAGDDTQAILMAALADSIDLEAVTIVAGNVEFDYDEGNIVSVWLPAGPASSERADATLLTSETR